MQAKYRINHRFSWDLSDLTYHNTVCWVFRKKLSPDGEHSASNVYQYKELVNIALTVLLLINAVKDSFNAYNNCRWNRDITWETWARDKTCKLKSSVRVLATEKMYIEHKRLPQNRFHLTIVMSQFRTYSYQGLQFCKRNSDLLNFIGLWYTIHHNRIRIDQINSTESQSEQ